MKITNYFRIVSWGILLFLSVGIAQAQKQVEGIAVRYIDNNKDIYHDKNEIHRKILIKEAILDAIEKGADISVKSITNYNVESVNIDNYEKKFEQFVSRTLQEYHVNWERTSQYMFSRDSKKKKKWYCRVEGNVSNIDFEAVGFDENGNSTINGGDQDLRLYITRKSFGKVHINAGNQDGLHRGDKLIVHKYFNKKSLAGYNQVKKVKAHIYITDAGNDFAVGNIVKGYYRQLKRNEIVYGTFNLDKGGIKYEFYTQEKDVKLTEFGDNSPIDIKSHAISFSHWNYLNKWGFEIGADIMDLRLPDNTSDIAFNPKLGAYRNFTILPELLYIQPKAHLGAMFLNINKEYFDVTEDDIILTFEGKLGVMFSLYAVDFSAGMSYRYVYSIDELTNFYPYFGVGYNLYR